MKSAGNVELFIARLIVTLPSSSGSRRIHVGMLREELLEVDRLGVHLELAGEEAGRLGQRAHRVGVQPLDHGGLGGVGPGNDDHVAPPRSLPGGPSSGSP